MSQQSLLVGVACVGLALGCSRSQEPRPIPDAGAASRIAAGVWVFDDPDPGGPGPYRPPFRKWDIRADGSCELYTKEPTDERWAVQAEGRFRFDAEHCRWSIETGKYSRGSYEIGTGTERFFEIRARHIDEKPSSEGGGSWGGDRILILASETEAVTPIYGEGGTGMTFRKQPAP